MEVITPNPIITIAIIGPSSGQFKYPSPYAAPINPKTSAKRDTTIAFHI